MSDTASLRPRGSYAVMASRVEPHNSLDFFITPPWATRALFTYCIDATGLRAWEPACGDGAMSRVIDEYAAALQSSDVHDYGWGHIVHDFLQPYVPLQIGGADLIVTNPPFRLAEQFVERGLQLAHKRVAILVRTVFIESAGRYENLFKLRPPAVVAQFVERVPMVKGRLDKTASTATSYCWLIWNVDRLPINTRLYWIPPCRKQLERDSDYNLEAA